MWQTLFFRPLLNALIFCYQFLGQNLGLAIIGLTLFIRGALTPLTLPSLKSAQKLQELRPELEAIKKKYGSDKQLFAQKQLEFYQKNGVNPASGCLPQIIQILVLVALYQAFNQLLAQNGDLVNQLNQHLYSPLKLSQDFSLNTHFLGLDLVKPDLFQFSPIKLGPLSVGQLPGLFLLSAAVVQFLSSKLMMPAAKATQAKSESTKEQADDMAAAMQQQMLYMMPLMTLFIGFRLPSGLVIYWLTFSLYMLVQQLLLKRKKDYGKNH